MKPLHPISSLSAAKLEALRAKTSDQLIESLAPGSPHALKVKQDGTIMDGHHRLHVLQERGIDVEGLPRETV